MTHGPGQAGVTLCEVCFDPAVVQGLYDDAARGTFRWVPLCRDCSNHWYGEDEVEHLFRHLEATS